MRRIKIVLVTLLFLIGCSDDELLLDNGDTEINRLRVPATASVGENFQIKVDFSYDNTDLFSGNDVTVMVELPNELVFNRGSQEIDEEGSDGNSVDVQEINCGLRTRLFFFVSDGDLRGAKDPQGDADAQLIFRVQANSSSNAAVISAAIDEGTTTFNCGANFQAEKTENIRIN